ncbi:MAG: hypothetical protein AB7S75_00350 [Desulfococcaceae bacterium]
MQVIEIKNIKELPEKIGHLNISPGSPLRIIIEEIKSIPNQMDFAFLNDDYWNGEVPSDLSLKHDEYLYGEE